MKLHIITIVLDGMPFITWHYPVFRRLAFEWHWWIVEGVALPKGCTKWCAPLEPRLSKDGTTDYLAALERFDKRVMHIARPSWPGKASMFNEALSRIEDEAYLLWQI